MPTIASFDERPVVIFDFDGTIADTTASIIETARTVLADWHLPEERLANVGQIIGPPFPDAFELVFGLSRTDAEEVTRRYRRIYTTLGPEAWPAFSGIRELLVDLATSGRKLAVASSKRGAFVRRGLEDNGLLELFDTVRAPELTLDQTKEEAIRLVLGDLGLTPADAVMVGDRFHDVTAARACGVPCVGVRYGDTADPGELEKAGAAAIAGTVEELRQILMGDVAARGNAHA